MRESLIFVGGLFGIVGMWFICVIMSCCAILVAPRLAPKLDTNLCFPLSLLRGVHVMAFLPEFWILNVPLPLWSRWSVVFTCCFTQLDLLNELFYAFTPSRTVIGEWRPTFDGVRQWMIWTGVPQSSMNPQPISPDVRDSLWAVLILLYVVHAARYIRLAILLHRSGIRNDTSESADLQAGSESGPDARTQGMLVELPDPGLSEVAVLDVSNEADGATPSSEPQPPIPASTC
jgi:hypothetical protein